MKLFRAICPLLSLKVHLTKLNGISQTEKYKWQINLKNGTTLSVIRTIQKKIVFHVSSFKFTKEFV